MLTRRPQIQMWPLWTINSLNTAVLPMSTLDVEKDVAWVYKTTPSIGLKLYV